MRGRNQGNEREIKARSRNGGKGKQSQYLNRIEETVQNKQVRDINE